MVNVASFDLIFSLPHKITVFEFLLQALMYPLLVACKSISSLRKAAAEEVVNKVRQHSGVLVEQVKCFIALILNVLFLLK